MMMMHGVDNGITERPKVAPEVNMNIVSDYLKKNGLQKLQDEYKIEVTHHPHLPLIILNYSQRESRPKNNPIIKNCRGLILELNTWNVVSHCIPRFFNWGEEIYSETDFAPQNPFDCPFNWNCCIGVEKIDGSYIAISTYNNAPLITTRSSFGHMKIYDPMQQKQIDKTWIQYVSEILGNRKLNPNCTHIFEFVAPELKIVKQYFKPELYLLTVFDNPTGKEWPWDTVCLNYCNKFKLPETKYFRSFEQVWNHIQLKDEKELHEGYVLRDNNNQRWKVKSKVYLEKHHLRGNNADNLFNVKYVIPILLANEQDEIYATWPEVRNTWETLRVSLENEYNKVLDTLNKVKHIENQKEFALAIKDCKFYGILFQLKYLGKLDEDSLKTTWLNSSRAILKVLYNK